ncbi:hypothetical protein D3C78_1785820 [compost metagenome]
MQGRRHSVRLLQITVEVMHHHAVAHRQRGRLAGHGLEQIAAVVVQAHLRQRVVERVGQALQLEVDRRFEHTEQVHKLFVDQP